MNEAAARYERLIGRFVAWAEANPDIRAAVMIGSRARTDRPADEWSDLDILVLATDPQRYLENLDWLEHIGPYGPAFLERTPDGTSIERRVLFEDGSDVDFIFFPTEAIRTALDPNDMLPEILRRGAKVVLDKDGTAAENLRRLAEINEMAAVRPPAEVDFLNLVNDFWYHTVWTAKKLRRGELWTAQQCSDGYLKRICLLPMIEWHARSIHGWAYDTWMSGRFLEQWADPRAVGDLAEAWAHHDPEDLWRGLFATMNLFRWLAQETADRLEYAYPAEADRQAVSWVEKLYEECESRADCYRGR